MKFTFYKYQGTGNDFVLIDNRNLFFPKGDVKLIAQLCHRKFGIGADGLLLLENNKKVDFTMHYFNADGKLGSMCGNGGRCIVHFAGYLGIINNNTIFEAVDGFHEAILNKNSISLKMMDVSKIDIFKNHTFLNTGSPHHVEMVDDIENFDVKNNGAFIRNNTYKKEGANINFVEAISKTTFAVRTFERGVEAETLSCGTGATAVAIAMFEQKISTTEELQLKTKGGILSVKFKKTASGYKNVYLEGPAVLVFKGKWE